MLDAFVWIMIDHYSERALVMPEIIKDNNEDLIDQDNKDENIIKELFEFTHSYDDYLTVADTNNYIITHSNISKTRYKLLLKQLGVIEKQIKLDKKNTKCYCGFKIKESERV